MKRMVEVALESLDYTQEDAAFENCVEMGGKVRRVNGPDKDHGLKEGEYVNYCFLDGQSHRGEVKKTKAQINKEAEEKGSTEKVRSGESHEENFLEEVFPAMVKQTQSRIINTSMEAFGDASQQLRSVLDKPERAEKEGRKIEHWIKEIKKYFGSSKVEELPKYIGKGPFSAALIVNPGNEGIVCIEITALRDPENIPVVEGEDREKYRYIQNVNPDDASPSFRLVERIAYSYAKKPADSAWDENKLAPGIRLVAVEGDEYVIYIWHQDRANDRDPEERNTGSAIAAFLNASTDFKVIEDLIKSVEEDSQQPFSDRKYRSIIG